MYQGKKHPYHTPVLTKEVIQFLNLKSGEVCPHTKNFGMEVYIDGTLGGGGHAEALLRQSKILNPGHVSSLIKRPKILLIGIDRDIEAIRMAKKRLKKYNDQIIFIHDNFRNLKNILDNLEIDKVEGILLDLGVSSYQLDNLKRGFSFKDEKDTPLDMRMDQGEKLTAYDIVNNYSQEDLKRIFFELGEEPFSRQIARAIVIRRQEKPISTANELLDVIRGATPPKYRHTRRVHFASKIFRALRMEVNQELEALREVLPQAIKRLKKNGRLVVISFHSLEDRIVKHFFREMKQEGKVEILTKKPLTPTPKEILLNPRAGSAKMRAIEKTNVKLKISNIK